MEQSWKEKDVKWTGECLELFTQDINGHNFV